MLALAPTPVLSLFFAHAADNGPGVASVLDPPIVHASTEDVDELLRHGTKLQNTNALKPTAAYFGRTDIIEHFLGKGIDVNETPYHEKMLLREKEIGLRTTLHEAPEVEAVRSCC